MIEDFLRDPAKHFPDIGNPEAVTALRVWFCKYRSLRPVAGLPNLETLIVAGYPDADLTPCAALTKLRYLHLLDFPKVCDLSPLIGLTNLVTLRLATPPSWDSSGRVLEVASLAPLSRLPQLQHLELFGVRPPDKSLAPLEESPALRTLRVSKYPKTEVARFRAATGLSNAFAPGPGVADWN